MQELTENSQMGVEEKLILSFDNAIGTGDLCL
jgi:hypothetical protein